MAAVQEPATAEHDRRRKQQVEAMDGGEYEDWPVGTNDERRVVWTRRYGCKGVMDPYDFDGAGSRRVSMLRAMVG